jgi:hypothetical protein
MYFNLWYCTLHWKKSWRKTPPAWPDVTDSLVRGTENYFDLKVKLIRWVPTTKTEYFEIIGISRRFFVLPRRSFTTIFHQLSDEWIIKSSSSGTRSRALQGYNPLLYHCATLPLYEIFLQIYGLKLHKLVEYIFWNLFLGSLKSFKFRLSSIYYQFQ